MVNTGYKRDTPKDVVMEEKAGIELFDDIISINNDPIHITLLPESSYATFKNGKSQRFGQSI